MIGLPDRVGVIGLQDGAGVDALIFTHTRCRPGDKVRHDLQCPGVDHLVNQVINRPVMMLDFIEHHKAISLVPVRHQHEAPQGFAVIHEGLTQVLPADAGLGVDCVSHDHPIGVVALFQCHARHVELDAGDLLVDLVRLHWLFIHIIRSVIRAAGHLVINQVRGDIDIGAAVGLAVALQLLICRPDADGRRACFPIGDNVWYKNIFKGHYVITNPEYSSILVHQLIDILGAYRQPKHLDLTDLHFILGVDKFAADRVNDELANQPGLALDVIFGIAR